MQSHHLSCKFWADQLTRRGKSDRNVGDEQAAAVGQAESLITIANAVLAYCLEQRNVPVGCLAAQFLFKNSGNRLDIGRATKCPITMSGYLNALKSNGDDNCLALCQFLAQILPQFECRIPLHSLGILLKLLKTNLNDNKVVRLINPNQLIHLWHHCLYVERGPNELNKTIGKNLIAILRIVGPAPIELFKQFLFHVPHFIRHKYLFMHHLLNACPSSSSSSQQQQHQVDEAILIKFFDQLARCLRGHWAEAEIADAFHATALRFLELDRAKLLAQLIWKTLISNNESIRANAVRLWFPKLNTSHPLRQTFTRLRAIARTELAPVVNSLPDANGQRSVAETVKWNVHSSLPYWYYDNDVDPCSQWSQHEIILWSFLQLFYWTTKNSVAALSADVDSLLDEDLQIVVDSLNGHHNKEEIKKIAADSLAQLFASHRHKWQPDKVSEWGRAIREIDPIVHQLIANVEHLLGTAESANVCSAINSLFTILFKFHAQKIGPLFKRHLQKLVKLCAADAEDQHIHHSMTTTATTTTVYTSTSSVIGNLMDLIECCVVVTPESDDDELKLDVQKLLLIALVYKNDSIVRQRSAKMALRMANNSANFKPKLINLFNETAPNLAYGIVHLYSTLLRLNVPDHELDMHFIGNDDGLDILFTRTKLSEVSETQPAATINAFLCRCVDVNEKLLQIGGSDCAAHCVTVSALHLLFEKCSSSATADDATDFDHDDDDEEQQQQLLFWSDSQKKQLSMYSNGLIQSCLAIRWILTNKSNIAGTMVGEAETEMGLRSIWTVLLRSHHKGILEHCGSDFGTCVDHLCAHFSSFPKIREEIVEQTLSILCQGGGQCRNIAFAKILLPIFASFRPIEKAKLINKIIAFDLGGQNSADDCDLFVDQRIKLHLHQLFLLKALLSTTKFDLADSRTEIFQFIMQITQLAMQRGQTERWRLFSLAGNAFAALLRSIFRPFPDIVPLHIFYAAEQTFCDTLLNWLRTIRLSMAQQRRSIPSIALLLVPLHRLFVVDSSIEHCAVANRFVNELSSELGLLIILEPSFLLRKQMAHVLHMVNPQTHHTSRLDRAKN